ncbi:MAG: hypothetical protein F4X66_04930 [Chloroflexi bacterium]|nr:hypothetical protein [Chloroflexota bacterium]
MPDDPGVNQLLNTRTGLMIATAKMVAHYVATAVQAGTPADTINAVLLEVTETTSIDEVFVSDADGNIEYGSHPGLNFKFPTDPGSDTQAAPFARLLAGTANEGTATVVVQAPAPREFDGAMFQYVGVSGIVRSRIVQVGIAGGP